MRISKKDNHLVDDWRIFGGRVIPTATKGVTYSNTHFTGNGSLLIGQKYKDRFDYINKVSGDKSKDSSVVI